MSDMLQLVVVTIPKYLKYLFGQHDKLKHIGHQTLLHQRLQLYPGSPRMQPRQ